MKDRIISIRLEDSLKRESEAIFNKLSITRSAAIQLFLQQVVIQQKIPFEVKSKKDIIK